MTSDEQAALGTPLQPADIYIWLRYVMALGDQEILDALVAGEADVASGAEGYLADLDDPDAVRAAGPPTRSRLAAWRKRGRLMTWDELRMLMIGLRRVELGDDDAPSS